MLGHDFGHVVHLYPGIEAAFRVDNHDRAERAQAEAAGTHNLDLVGQALLANFLFQDLNNFLAV